MEYPARIKMLQDKLVGQRIIEALYTPDEKLGLWDYERECPVRCNEMENIMSKNFNRERIAQGREGSRWMRERIEQLTDALEKIAAGVTPTKTISGDTFYSSLTRSGMQRIAQVALDAQENSDG